MIPPVLFRRPDDFARGGEIVGVYAVLVYERLRLFVDDRPRTPGLRAGLQYPETLVSPFHLLKSEQSGRPLLPVKTGRSKKVDRPVLHVHRLPRGQVDDLHPVGRHRVPGLHIFPLFQHAPRRARHGAQYIVDLFYRCGVNVVNDQVPAVGGPGPAAVWFAIRTINRQGMRSYVEVTTPDLHLRLAVR